jgi:hypothetical protein
MINASIGAAEAGDDPLDSLSDLSLLSQFGV